MLIEVSPDAFTQAPVGRFTSTGSCVVWCASRTLCGARLWGRPDGDETRAIMRIFDAYPRVLDPVFDIVMDTRDIEVVRAEALAVLTRWIWGNRSALLERIRVTSLIREGPIGYLFAGLLPTLGKAGPLRVTTDVGTAFGATIDHTGVQLANEVDAIAARLRGVPRELQVIHALLAQRLDARIEDAAKELGSSPRSLQRWLRRRGTSFHDEVVSARFAAACELLRTTDLKVAAVGARLGISERAVTLLFRARTGLSPSEWRAKERA